MVPLKLLQANFIIEQFIQSCSHDLKGPLCSIEGLLSLTRNTSLEVEKQHCLDLMSGCVSALKHKVESLEECTSNLQRDLTLTDIDAHEILESVVMSNAPALAQRGISLEYEVREKGSWISDFHCQFLILNNLVRNSISFSDSTKLTRKVKVNVTIKSDSVMMEVADNGIGISEQDQQRIFDPFTRCSSMSNGAGLGLFVVKALVNKLSGSLVLRSTERIGTTFLITTPNF